MERRTRGPEFHCAIWQFDGHPQTRSIVRTCVPNGQVPLRTLGRPLTCGYVQMFEAEPVLNPPRRGPYFGMSVSKSTPRTGCPRRQVVSDAPMIWTDLVFAARVPLPNKRFRSEVSRHATASPRSWSVVDLCVEGLLRKMVMDDRTVRTRRCGSQSSRVPVVRRKRTWSGSHL